VTIVDNHDSTRRPRRGEQEAELHAAQDQLAHELLPDEEREMLRDRVLALRAALRWERA
jgi:hypothetical protein